MNIHRTILTAVVALGLAAQAHATYPIPNPVDPIDPVVSYDEQSESEQFVPTVVKIGFEGTMLYGVGLRVDNVEYGNTAELVGLTAGDVVTHVNGVAVQTPDHFRDLLMTSFEMQQGQVELAIAGPGLESETRTVVCNVRGNLVRIDAGPTY
jgi:hypothetical protein